MTDISQIKEVPHCYDVERSFLSCLLLDPDLRGQSDLNKDDFYNPQHRKIYASISNLYKKWMSVDVTMLSTEWCDTDYLFDLASDIPSLASFNSYHEVIKQHSIYRHVMKVSKTILAMAQDKKELSNIFNEAKKILDTPTNNDQGVEIFDAIEEYIENIWIVSSSICNYWFEELDKKTNWIGVWELIVVGAGTSTWKTLFAMNIAEQVIRQWHWAALFPLEMTPIAMAKRLAAKLTWVPSNQLDKMDDAKESIKLMINEAKGKEELGTLKIFKKENRYHLIEKRIRREALQNNTKFFIVDHLWLIVEQKRGVTKSDATGYVTWWLKRLAEELWVAILLLSQLNRSWQKDEDMNLSALRWSWDIEQDANVVIFLQKEYDALKIHLAKVRDWETWILYADIDYPLMTVSNIRSDLDPNK